MNDEDATKIHDEDAALRAMLAAHQSPRRLTEAETVEFITRPVSIGLPRFEWDEWRGWKLHGRRGTYSRTPRVPPSLGVRYGTALRKALSKHLTLAACRELSGLDPNGLFAALFATGAKGQAIGRRASAQRRGEKKTVIALRNEIATILKTMPRGMKPHNQVAHVLGKLQRPASARTVRRYVNGK